jgi:glycosyltransferase involved in cell wall biosynthesis
MKKIAIITPFLANGGLEKVAVITAKGLSENFDVTLIVMDSYKIDYPYNGKIIDLGVSLRSRNFVKRIYNTLLSIYRLKKLKNTHGYDVVISHGELANIPSVLSRGNKNILTIHSNRFAFKSDLQGKFVNIFIKYLYSSKYINKFITVSNGIRDSFIDKYNINPERISTIYNPIDINQIKSLSTEELNEYDDIFKNDVLITVGRLSFAKGQWYLLRIFQYLLKSNSNLKLVILGDGELRDRLMKLSEELNLKTYSIWKNNNLDSSYSVYFLGFQKNPFKFIKCSKLFEMTSLWEGFGNTIVEAMACGTPVISTVCKSGPNEIINPNLENANKIQKANYQGFGVLMPIFNKKYVNANTKLNAQEELWISTLENLLSNFQKRNEYSQKGLKRADYFQMKSIFSEWKKMIESETD